LIVSLPDRLYNGKNVAHAHAAPEMCSVTGV
jgi:hypothetical protein